VAQIKTSQLIEISIEVESNLAAIFGRIIVAKVSFNALVIARIIMQKTNVHTARWETISRADAGFSKGQYKGNVPQRT